jgi:hypothetical protein
MLGRTIHLTLALVLLLFGSRANPDLQEVGEQVRAYTRQLEFDYVEWTVDAVWVKLRQAALGLAGYLELEAQSDLARDYVRLVAEIQYSESQLAILHANPDQATVAEQIADLGGQLDAYYAQRANLAPLAESVLQAQIAAVVAEFDLAGGGQPLPPLLYHSTPLPWALIASPRDAIRQDANISLQTELTLDEHIVVEDAVSAGLDLSTLVVPVGGIGSYPTMVAQTSSLNWLAEVVAHEWIHNYLTWHPLGFLYSESPELTTMNETTASIAGKTIGARVIERFYPELVPPPPAPAPPPGEENPAPLVDPPPFDFRAEMHATRITVDALLAEGAIEEAEEYMEERRLYLWDNGYPIRKLNQAYFAFYGSYADVPVGPAGEDPVGEAVRALWAQSASLKDFLDYMDGLTSFADLQGLLASLQ